MRILLALTTLFALTPSADAQVTYSKEVSRIFQAKCQTCHREGDIGPFALDSYDAAKSWGDDIQRVLREKIMPPWKPVAGHGEFKDNFGLTDADRQLILDWYSAGAAQGDVADLPEPLAATGEWQLGDPDVVLQMPELYNVPRRKDIYRCFVVPTGFDTDVWLKAMQVLPGNKQVVHHVILYLDESNKSMELDAADPEPGYECFGGPGDGVPLTLSSFAGGWVPGTRAGRSSDGIGIKIPKSAKAIIQVHYFPGGRTASDQTRVGLYLSKPEEKIEKQMVFLPLVNTRFKIPAGAESYDVSAAYTVIPGLSAKVHLVVPHMHLLGKRIEVTRSNSFNRTSESMVLIDNWDFNWQGFYGYEKPVQLNVFDQLKVTCNFNNSASNPKNPANPLKVVGWGEGTEDEMCLAFLGLTFDSADLSAIPFQAQPKR